jgi:hypothetical protein
MKTCFKCGKSKLLVEFYSHPRMRDGHLNKCKLCTRRDVRAHRKANLEAVRAYDRSRSRTEQRIASAALVTREWRERLPAARVAQHAVGNAMQSMKLTRQPCEVCGAKRVHAHHDDYLKPLDVRWLCAAHHKEHHMKHGPGMNASSVPHRKRGRAA